MKPTTFFTLLFILSAALSATPTGYPNAPLPVIDPAAALSWLTQE
jgi:hypothetical protein